MLLAEGLTANAMSYLFVARALTKGPIEHGLMKAIVKSYLPCIQVLCLHFLRAFSSAIREQNEQLFVYL
jgi:hypothetical protein